GMIMCAYNKINGVQACDRADLLDKLARQAWGFQGIIRGDGGAFHSLDSITATLDQELPTPLAWGDRLLAAVKDGRIPISAVDTAVERVLRTMMVYGIFDDPPSRTGADVAADSQVAERIAAHAAVLLKNRGGLLPLSDKTVRRIAVIGSAADDLTLAGGLANPAPKGKVTILEGLRSRARGAAVDYQPGVDPISAVAEEPGFAPIASAALGGAAGQTGADAIYYDAKGAVLGRRTDRCLCYVGAGIFNGNAKAQLAPAGAAKVVWTAKLTIEAKGSYGFDVVTNGAAELKIDDAVVVAGQPSPSLRRTMATTELTAGEHRLQATYELGQRWREAPERGSGVAPRLKIGWRRPPGVVDAGIRAAAVAARQADVAIVVVRDFESEGMDRASLTLPNDQDRLIAAVAKANPKTVVVLSTGSAVTMPWLARTPAVLEAWYGGTRAGPAVAQVLFGDVNPSGRLPVTFPARDADLATFDPARFPGDGKVTVFGEKMSTGYRRFTAPGAPRPLFPFGYGLSYTTFAYSGLSLDRAVLTPGQARHDGTFKGRRGVTASFTVRNTGARAGAVTPQVYVEYPGSAAEPAPLLKGFDKVELAPGRSKTVRVVLDQQAFASFDEKAGGWRLAPGAYKVRVGDAAGATPLAAALTVR
ncbi:MAG: glycoside hydrolase family 3 C-terminal domain-containing protein, partial [Proteobacteria bacterium]|nr:glycoside hydrolase family 3 C-terminal domain-containing protein [Pseudomonadota bacterium]